MAGATFSRVKSWSTGETLTASDLNAEFDNILTNLTPAGIDDQSTDASAMQATEDPYPGGSASAATDLAGELQRLRYVIQQLSGSSYWYVDPLATTMIGTGTRDISLASSTQEITGVGFQPKTIIILAGIDTSAAMSIGMGSSSLASYCIYNRYQSAGTFSIQNNYIALLAPSAAGYGYAVIDSVGADGFTLNWGKSSSPTGTATFYYLCIR